jgi:hypothetical protein
MGIRDFRIFGDLHRLDDVESSCMWRLRRNYCPGDLIYLQQDRNLARIRHSFDKLPCAMNLYIVTEWVGRVWDYKLAHQHVDKLLGRACQESDAITFVMTSNVTGPNTLPFTPWIIAHRLAHAWHFREFSTERLNYIPDLLKTVGETFSGVDHMLHLYHSMGTLMACKSARDMILFNELDIEAELLAQVIIQGSVRLLPHAEWAERFAAIRESMSQPSVNREQSVRRLQAVHLLEKFAERHGAEQVDAILRRLEQNLTEKLNAFLLSLRGHVLAF